MANPKALPGTALSRDERRVLQVIADGCSIVESARRLYMSESTVKSHLKAIFRRLEANNQARAVLRAVQTGWLDPVTGQVREVPMLPVSPGLIRETVMDAMLMARRDVADVVGRMVSDNLIAVLPTVSMERTA